MQITHFSNSFIVVESNGIKLCCDPWVGKANYGGWHSYPEYDKKNLIQFLADTDIVYISHLHEDHFDPKFLIESGLINKKFILKNFEVKTLVNRIKGSGAADVNELDNFEIFKYKHLNIAIVPQMTSNTSELDEYVHYDLDTSIIINDQDVTFFNQVDNPFSTADYIKIKEWINVHFGDLHVVALMAGAASEYPQAFFNIDREAAKQKIINESLVRLKEKLNTLQPGCYFPAGGTYFIPGKFSVLNKYIAQPGLNDITAMIKENHIKTIPLFIEGAKQINVNSVGGYEVLASQPVLPISTSMSKSISEHRSDKYEYELEENPSVPDLNIIESIFEAAKKSWKSIMDQKDIEISEDMRFVVYEDLLVNDECRPDPKCKIIKVFELIKPESSKGELTIHLDIRSFFLCLIRKKVWNGTIGSLCLFEREPNVFYPSDTFSLNYLVIGKDELATLLK